MDRAFVKLQVKTKACTKLKAKKKAILKLRVKDKAFDKPRIKKKANLIEKAKYKLRVKVKAMIEAKEKQVMILTKMKVILGVLAVSKAAQAIKKRLLNLHDSCPKNQRHQKAPGKKREANNPLQCRRNLGRVQENHLCYHSL